MLYPHIIIIIIINFTFNDTVVDAAFED